MFLSTAAFGISAPSRLNASKEPLLVGTKACKDVLRDIEINHALVEAGWRPVRVCEHEDPTVAAGQIGDLE